MASSEATGSQTAVIDTEHTLATVSTDGTFVLYVDTSNMVLADKTTLRVKVKVTSGGTTRLFLEATYAHVQGMPIIASIPVASINECVFTLEQVAGTGRSYDWEVIKL